jgi:hypothetical protein
MDHAPLSEQLSMGLWLVTELRLGLIQPLLANAHEFADSKALLAKRRTYTTCRQNPAEERGD